MKEFDQSIEETPPPETNNDDAKKDKKEKDSKDKSKSEKELALVAALRANLKKRKVQQKIWKETPKDSEPKNTDKKSY